MRKDKAFKVAVCLASMGLFFSMPSYIARASNLVPAEQGVAGITYTLDNYYASVPEEEAEAAEKALSTILQTEILSPYKNLGVSKADNYVNIRKEPSTESEIVGKLYRGCATDILERLEGDWVKIKSGNVEGYIASNYLAIGKDAEGMVDEYATKYATVLTTTLNVREKQSTNSKILTQIPLGETYVVVKEYDEWVEILLGSNGDDEQGDFTGFVKKEDGNVKLVDIDVEFKFAISIEEENAIRRAQEEAERAERERQEQLAREEEARRKAEEAARKAEAERKAEQAAKKAEASKKENSSSTQKPSKSSSDIASLQQEIVTYALKFVGNRYVWGGESLTNGADCSGFTWRIYKDFGYSIPRTSREQAVSAGRQVKLSDRQPGDLLFYTNSSGTVNHVAIYIGNDRIVHAANSRQGIITSKYNYRDVYRVRRVVN